MTQKRISWTEQQLRAILARDSDVFVSASAGTGKTAVLSARCVSIVSDKNLCPDLWSVLVLTFTDAAAEQMRLRIAEQLNDEFLSSRDPHLRYQLALLHGADISTIHSFCKRLITQYFYKLALDPTFRVIDADEQTLIKAQVLEKTIDWAWRQQNLADGLRQLFYRRDLRAADGFLARVIQVSDFLDGLVGRQSWYERAALFAQAENSLLGTLGRRQKEIIADQLQLILAQLQHCAKLCESHNASDLGAQYEQKFISPVMNCYNSLRMGDWDGCARLIADFKKPRSPVLTGLPKTIADIVREAASQALDSFTHLAELAVLNPDYLDRVGVAAGLQTKLMVELVRKFDQLYSQAKRAVNCLDFADLERYALRLLADENSADDSLSPSQTALLLRERYRYIFVDEYQDINPLQQAILNLLSGGANVFGVGDVKQSIYAWRGAEPAIFLERLKGASVAPKAAAGGLRVDLNANFRSAKGILDFVNKVFTRLMTAPFADIDYDDLARLRRVDESQSTGAENAPLVQIHLLDEDADLEQDQQDDQSFDTESSDVITPRQRQAVLIAQRIRQMVGAETGRAEFQIYDKHNQASRDVQYRDIVILMRSLAGKAGDYVELLRLAGVPVRCDAVAGYFEAAEISDLLSVLKVLDNPLRDIELAAVLRSPLFAVTDTELAKIKLHAQPDRQNRNFHNTVGYYCSCGPDSHLADKLKSVLGRLEQWRTLARRGRLADLIWRIYRETGFLSFVSALPNGQVRRANLLRLHNRAIQFEGFASSAGVASLARFVEFIEKLQDIGQDWAPAEPDSSAENAVRILTVHKSKGLEFPVVFLAELNTGFNKRDVYADCLADADYTLGLQVIDRQSNSRLSSLAHQVIAEKKHAASLAEEMRILYVAATRAKERLVLTASAKSSRCRNTISRGFLCRDQSLSRWQLRRCKNPLEWVLYGLCDQKSLHCAFETGFADAAADDGLFTVKLYGRNDLDELTRFVHRSKTDRLKPPHREAKEVRSEHGGVELLSQIKSSLTWRYPFCDATLVPAKLSVTQWTHRDDEYVKIDYSHVLEKKPAVLSRGGDLPETLQARLVGTAAHLLIAELDLTGTVSTETIEKTKQKLIADGAIDEAAGRNLDSGLILRFFQSELGQRVLDGSNVIWREWPFTFAVPAREFANPSDDRCSLAGADTVVVQGIIDMLVRTPNGLLVIDFKTDRISSDEIHKRAQLYRRQLELYGRAAAAILKEKVASKWLYFLTPACALEI